MPAASRDRSVRHYGSVHQKAPPGEELSVTRTLYPAAALSGNRTWQPVGKVRRLVLTDIRSESCLSGRGTGGALAIHWGESILLMLVVYEHAAAAAVARPSAGRHPRLYSLGRPGTTTLASTKRHTQHLWLAHSAAPTVAHILASVNNILLASSLQHSLGTPPRGLLQQKPIGLGRSSSDATQPPSCVKQF